MNAYRAYCNTPLLCRRVFLNQGINTDEIEESGPSGQAEGSEDGVAEKPPVDLEDAIAVVRPDRQTGKGDGNNAARNPEDQFLSGFSFEWI